MLKPLESKGAQSEEETVCARMFWQLSAPTEKTFVLLLMERVQSTPYTDILCLVQERQETISFMLKLTLLLRSEVIPPKVGVICKQAVF